jgi:sulfoxide reductase catalytic subunit YedY
MGEPPSTAGAPEPLERALTDADDRLRLDHWTPPQAGIIPRVRLGQRWISVLWALPIGTAALIVLIAVAQSLRDLPQVNAFILRHPGVAQSAPSVDSGFPWWLQLQHFLNMFFMLFIVRAGLQILADHPRLYWRRDCTPGTDWFRFQVAVPKDRIWTAKDDSVTLPAWLGIPGERHTLGLSRWWHFSVNFLWVINGVVFYGLLFATETRHPGRAQHLGAQRLGQPVRGHRIDGPRKIGAERLGRHRHPRLPDRARSTARLRCSWPGLFHPRQRRASSLRHLAPSSWRA